MKLIRKNTETSSPLSEQPRQPPWKVLVVDDEADIRRVTALNLKGFEFAGRGLQLLEAASAAEARTILMANKDIAVALIDVVMETDDAGLLLVETIRFELGNKMTRLIIRTGQPGVAPERYVIDNFDIDDYKDKTELTSQKLYTAIRSALKAYRDLQSIELNRRGLEQVLEATPELYQLQRVTLESFLEGILKQIIATCHLTHTGMISTIDGLLTTIDGGALHLQAGIGQLNLEVASPQRIEEIVTLCSQAVRDSNQQEDLQLRDGGMIVPLSSKTGPLGFVYLEAHANLSDDDKTLIQIMANQCAAALENFHLKIDLQHSYERVVEMLGVIAEFKDSSTGSHINRISEYVRLLAIEMGFSDKVAEEYGRAARLHDVGKVGIPDAILRKPGPLSEEEFCIIKRHTEIGRSILGSDPQLFMAREIAYSHHEHWDGTGYPQGLAGEEISIACRLASVADVFDALISIRPYKNAWPIENVLKEIQAQSGKHFDPSVVEAFLRIHQQGKLAHILRKKD